MKTLRKRARVILSTLILAAFFIPSYKGLNGFGFISVAFAETKTNHEITSTDVMILVIPLLLVPLTALGIWLATWLKISMRTIYTALPLICLFGFTAVLLMSAPKNSVGLSNGGLLLKMGFGFYVALLASLCLPFTQNPKKKKIRRHRSAVIEQAA